MSRVSFTLDTRELSRELRRAGADAPKIAVQSLNRTIRSLRTFTKRELARDTGMKAGDVNRRLSIQNASRAKPAATLLVPEKRVPLIEMGARGKEPSRGRGRGVTYRTGSGRKRLEHAFIATMPGGHKGVFIRPTSRAVRRGRPPQRSWLPIRELFGPSLAAVVGRLVPQMRRHAGETLEKEIRGRLERMFAKRAA